MMKQYPQWLVMLVGLCAILCLINVPVGCTAGKKGTLRKRIKSDSDTSEDPPMPSSSTTEDPRWRGGARKRRLEHAAEESAASSTSDSRQIDPLTNDLKRRWAKGEISSAAVQSLGNNARLQGARNLEAISAIGSYGAHAQNLFRDVVRLFGMPKGAPPIDWIELPLKGGRKMLHPILWPHNFFQALPRGRADIWRSRVTGTAGAAQQFWDSIAHTDFVRRHPFLPSDAWRDIIPLGFHGDGGGFNKHDSLYTLSWNSLLAVGQTVQTRFLFSVIKKSDMVADTLDTIVKALSWSMNVLLSGQTPYTDWQNRCIDGGGVDLASGTRGCLVQVRGDWEFFVQLVFPALGPS